MKQIESKYPEIFKELFRPCRYKVFYGGRGGGKSWSVAIALIILSYQKSLRILCTREYQRSIADSVHRLLVQSINYLTLDKYFKVTDKNITCLRTGSIFIFKGTHHNINEIKSTEGIDICWVEEAQNVSSDSWDILIPTIRKDKSEIWVTFNPFKETDPTYQRFIVNTPPNTIVKKVNYYDNPFLSETVLKEIENAKILNADDFSHVWLGECKRISDALIFKDRFEVKNFDIPKTVDRWFIGVDWGFSVDPTAIISCYIQDNVLYIPYEIGGVGLDFEEIYNLLNDFQNGIVNKWGAKADNSRPETINYLYNRGINIAPAKKWQGSVEDGIEFLKSFKKIVIHPNCKEVAQEFFSYSYKVDKVTNTILPLIEDKNNHYIDALRYSLDGYIRNKSEVNYGEVNKKWFK